MEFWRKGLATIDQMLTAFDRRLSLRLLVLIGIAEVVGIPLTLWLKS